MTAATATAPEKDLLSRRTLTIGIGAAATAGVAGLMTPRRYLAGVDRVKLEELVPAAVGAWAMQRAGDFILPDDPAATSAYDQIVTRRFSALAGPDIMLLIAHGAAQSGLIRVHRPEACYASEGFQIRDFHGLDLSVARGHSTAVDKIAAQAFLGVRDDRVESVLYWTRIAGFFPRDRMAQRLIMLRLGLEGVIPDGVLVRISALGAGETAAALVRFAGELVRACGPEGRTLLLGPQDSRSLT